MFAGKKNPLDRSKWLNIWLFWLKTITYQYFIPQTSLSSQQMKEILMFQKHIIAR